MALCLAVTSWLVPAANGAAAAPPRPVVRPEVPVTATDERRAYAHNSPVLASDPGDPRIVALASRIDNPGFSCSLHISGDGGRSWLPSDPVPRLPKGADSCYAPEIAFDDNGVLHYLFIGLHGAGNRPMGAFLTSSSSRGFSPPRKVLGPERYMVRMALDRSRGGQGRLYLVWLASGAAPALGGLAEGPNPIMSAYSDDGGTSFSKPVQVNDPARSRVVAPALALGADGAVHVAYYDLRDDARDYQGLEGPVWEGAWSLVVSTSTDGGRSFGRHAEVADDVVPPARVMLIYTMPPPSLVADEEGKVHVAWHDARNGDWDALVATSADGGRRWGPPVRLNDDGRGNGRHQYLPRLALGPGGRLDAVFYDRRADAQNLRTEVSYTWSTDGGTTFAPNVDVTTEGSNSLIGPRYPIPSARGLVEYGSRLALLSGRDGVLAAWTDTRNAKLDTFQQDVFATSVELAADSGGDVTGGGTGGRAGALWDGAGWLAAGGGVVGAAALLGVRWWRRARG